MTKQEAIAAYIKTPSARAKLARSLSPPAFYVADAKPTAARVGDTYVNTSDDQVYVCTQEDPVCWTVVAPSRADPSPLAGPVRCAYCDTLTTLGARHCESCGAPF